MSTTNEQNSDPATGTNEREARRKVVGVVVSDKMQKTITVREERMVKHPKYSKYIRRYTKYRAHDANQEAKIGDRVEIMQTRPIASTKNWRLVKILQRAVTE